MKYYSYKYQVLRLYKILEVCELGYDKKIDIYLLKKHLLSNFKVIKKYEKRKEKEKNGNNV